MKNLVYRVIGCMLAGIAGLFTVSGAGCMVLSLLGMIAYPSLGERFLSMFLYLVITFVFFQVTRFGWRLFRKGRGEQDAKKKSPVLKSAAESPETENVPEKLNDISYISELVHESQGPWQVYYAKLAARPYGWETTIDWADYMIHNEMAHVDKVTCIWNVGGRETDLTEAYRKHGSLKGMEILNREGSMLAVAGVSLTLKTLMKISWYNQTNVMTFYTIVDDEEQINRYIETAVTRSFGTSRAMAKAETVPSAAPVSVTGNRINLDETGVTEYLRKTRKPYECRGVMKLEEKTPTVVLCENGHKVQEYVLKTAEGEDFTDWYFHYSVRITPMGNPPVPGVQIDGFAAKSAEDTEIGRNIGYRFEGYYPRFGGMLCETRRKAQEGRDLYEKGLRYQGYVTPGNIRLVGVCSHCGRSITFKGYNYPMMQAEPLYSDDGLHVSECYDADFDRENGTVEKDGRIYRYYNSFRCCHCGEPYIDYASHHEMKKFGILGCTYEL